MEETMSKIAFIFPGQGSQYVGMGRDFYEKEEAAQKVFDEAAAVTGLDLKHICFEENEELNQTMYTQIAMFFTDFHTAPDAGGAWEQDREYFEYQWWLARTEGGDFEIVTWGY